MKTKIKTATFAILSFGISALSAQSSHEFSVHAGGGLSTLNYTPTIGERNPGLGGQVGVGYTYFFSPNWGIRTGLELAFYNSKFKMESLQTQYRAFDKYENTFFDFRSEITDYRETQRATMLQIPLMAQFQHPITENRQFYASAGMKLGFIRGGKYENSGNITNSGFYEYENALYNEQEFRGFGRFAGQKNSTGLDFKTAFLASAEVGMKWQLNSGRSLYTGVYFDYGLNNIMNASEALPPFVEFNPNPPAFGVVNSIFYSEYHDVNRPLPRADLGAETTAFTNNVKPVAVGVTLRLALNVPKQQQPQQQASARQSRRAERMEIKANDVQPKFELAHLEDVHIQEDVKRNLEQIPNLEVGERITLYNTYYKTNMADLSPESTAELQHLVLILEENPTLCIKVSGHTDNVGRPEYNMQLSESRAKVVVDYLVKHGISAERLTYAGFGQTRPIADNATAEGRTRNRRVEIKILER